MDGIHTLSVMIGALAAVWVGAAIIQKADMEWYSLPAALTGSFAAFVIVGFGSALLMGWHP